MKYLIATNAEYFQNKRINIFMQYVPTPKVDRRTSA